MEREKERKRERRKRGKKNRGGRSLRRQGKTASLPAASFGGW